jgi:hypothetical protein
MKLEAQQVRFRTAIPWFTRRRLRFIGNRNTLQLLDTALVVEGYQMRFFFPVLDLFFRQPLSEWTTVTVPYSRILRFRYASRLLLRILVIGMLWLPVTLVLVVGLFALPWAAWADLGYLLVLLALLSLVLTLYYNFRLIAPRNYLWYRQADGRRALLVFRIRSRKLQRAFEQQLTGYRQAIRDRGAREATMGKEERR